MAELVSAARIGRSLGVHLILATQKPTGVVDDQIWTNSRFKLCLKVQNTSDSNEMLHTPDAASIVNPGRAYLQVGNNEVYEMFQSAWSGEIYSSTNKVEREEDNRVYIVNRLGQGELINKDLSGNRDILTSKSTQLDVTVKYLEHINFRDKSMVINHTVTKGMEVKRTNSTKSEASSRRYPLNDEQINMFKQLKSKEDINRKLFGSEYVENDYIFKHADGTLYYPDYPSKVFKKVIKANPDLPQGITFHGLRSSCVSILVHEGHDVKSIQKWVGHADIDTTLRIYAKVKDKASKQEISDSMSGKIQPKKYNESDIEN